MHEAIATVYTIQYKQSLAAPAISVLHQDDYEQWLVDVMWKVLMNKPNLYSGVCFLLFSMFPDCWERTDGSIVKKFSAPNQVNLLLPCIRKVLGHSKMSPIWNIKASQGEYFHAFDITEHKYDM